MMEAGWKVSGFPRGNEMHSSKCEDYHMVVVT